jgi:hypothetical protein
MAAPFSTLKWTIAAVGPRKSVAFLKFSFLASRRITLQRTRTCSAAACKQIGDTAAAAAGDGLGLYISGIASFSTDAKFEVLYYSIGDIYLLSQPCVDNIVIDSASIRVRLLVSLVKGAFALCSNTGNIDCHMISNRPMSVYTE